MNRNRISTRTLVTTALLLVTIVLAAACTVPSVPAALQEAAGAVEPPADGQGPGIEVVPDQLDVQGHRGARGLQPENTLPAFETALDLGVDTLELDLHFAADNAVVVWHDNTIDAGKCRLDPSVASPTAPDPETAPPFDLRVRRLTLAQLQQYRCDRNPNPRAFPAQSADPTVLAGDDYGIPTPAEVFTFVERYAAAGQKTAAQRETAQAVRFNVETKRAPDKPWAIGDGFDGTTPGAFERAVVALIEENDLVERTVVQSFDHRSIWAVQQLNPQITLAALTSRPLDVAAIAEQGAAILSPRSTLVTPSLIEEAHALGLKVIPWTINEVAEMQRLIEMGVDGIITDRPDLLVE